MSREPLTSAQVTVEITSAIEKIDAVLNAQERGESPRLELLRAALNAVRVYGASLNEVPALMGLG